MDERHHKNTGIGYIAKPVSLIIYLAFLFWRMFFYAYSNFFRVQSKTYEYNLVPLKTIYSLITGYSKYDLIVWVYNLFGNILVFIPLGFLLISLQREKSSIKTALIISLFIVLFAELMQLILKVGVFDVDDIILNLIGSLIGCGIYKVIFKRKLLQA
ncbi:MAG: VanZ family protein [Caulobacteraceae bacterium]